MGGGQSQPVEPTGVAVGDKPQSTPAGGNKPSAGTPAATSPSPGAAAASGVTNASVDAAEVEIFTLTSTGLELKTFKTDDGSRFYFDDESGEWAAFPEEWITQGSFKESDNVDFEIATDDQGVEYTTYRTADGTLYYVDFEHGEWVPFPVDRIDSLSFRAQTEVYNAEEEDPRMQKIVDEDGNEVSTYLAQHVVDLQYYFDDDKEEWVKFPFRKQIELAVALGLDITGPRIEFKNVGDVKESENVEDLLKTSHRPKTSGGSLNDATNPSKDSKDSNTSNDTSSSKNDAATNPQVVAKMKEDAATIRRLEEKVRLLEIVESENLTFKKEAAAAVEADEARGVEIRELKGAIAKLETDLEGRDLKISQNRAAESSKVQALKNSLKTKTEDVKRSKRKTDKFRKQVVELEQKLTEVSSDNSKVAALQQEISQMRAAGDERFQTAMKEKDVALAAAREDLTAAQVALAGERGKNEELSSASSNALRDLRTEVQSLRQAYRATRKEAKEMPRTFGEITKKLQLSLLDRVKDMGSESDLLREKLMAESTLRRKLYNQLQEMRGNIRVYVRVRGMSQKELGEDDRNIVSVPSKTEFGIETKSGSVRKFEFDRVFGPDAGQADVFQDMKPLVQSCVDGFNVCMFAYGQTGSGKTYTMMGVPGNQGVNLRALQELFRITKSQADVCEYSVQVSFLEIYNEQIRDLLDPHMEGGKKASLDVRAGPDGMCVPGLTETEVKGVEDVMEVISTGDSHRTVAQTKMNTSSSRSHSIVVVKVMGKSKINGARTLGKLTLVDLAGSERASRTDAKGSRLVEAAAINKSLRALGQVMQALRKQGAGGGHVPYRNSKLTRLLQDSIGGNSKTLMFLCASPAGSNSDETINSLRFGQGVRQVVGAGPAKKNNSPPGAPTGSRSLPPPPGGRPGTAIHR